MATVTARSKSDSPSPLNRQAEELCRLTQSAALSIYEFRSPENRFLLAGATGWDPPPSAPAPSFTVDDSHRHNGTWIGLTSFVARTGKALRLDSVDEEIRVELDGVMVMLRRDGASCELQRPGPFLAVPVWLGDEVVGVIRAVRREEDVPFTPADESSLIDYASLLAAILEQARTYTSLITSLFDIARIPDEDQMLEGIAIQAVELVHGRKSHSAIFIRDLVTDDFVFRAPKAAAQTMEQKVYRADSKGLTAEVLRTGHYLLSLDLERDLGPNGRLRHLGHVSKRAETPSGETRSFMAVPILDRSGSRQVLGVIRVSSHRVNAFSHHDVETLRALAQHLSLLLDERRRLYDERERFEEERRRVGEAHARLETEQRRVREEQQRVRGKESLFATLIQTSERPIVMVDGEGSVGRINPAARELLGLPTEEEDRDAENPKVLGRDVVELVYGGNRALAGSVNYAIREAAREKRSLRDHHTVFYRYAASGERIPIPVRLTASPLVDDETGRPIGSIGFFDDLRFGPSTNGICRIGDGRDSGVTVDPLIASAVDTIEELRETADPALIIAETGTGKELLVETIHRHSKRRGEMRRINCAEVRDDMLELFGSVPGAFTGAENLAGIFEEADKGTVFLDEIADLSLTAQAKLLRVLEKGQVFRLGETKPRAVDVRVIGATNKNLRELADVSPPPFREELLFRLQGYEFTLPPLRERRGDIILLAHHFLDAKRAELGQKEPRAFSSDVIRAFLAYKWPGNVRELKKAVETAVKLCLAKASQGEDPRLIQERHIPLRIREAAQGPPDPAQSKKQVKELEAEVAALRHDLVARTAMGLPTDAQLDRILRQHPELGDHILKGKKVNKDVKKHWIGDVKDATLHDALARWKQRWLSRWIEAFLSERPDLSRKLAIGEDVQDSLIAELRKAGHGGDKEWLSKTLPGVLRGRTRP